MRWMLPSLGQEWDLMNGRQERSGRGETQEEWEREVSRNRKNSLMMQGGTVAMENAPTDERVNLGLRKEEEREPKEEL